MQRINLTGSLSVSRLVYGMWRLADDPNTSPEHVRNKMSACLDQGITTVDQADIYGGYKAEQVFGEALRGTTLRNQIEIITKCDIVAPVGRYSDAPGKYYDTSRTHILASVDHSLTLMGIEHIDLLLIHRPDPLMDHFDTGAALDQVVASGKVRAVGVSNFKPYDWDLLQSAMTQKLVTNQIELSVLENLALTNGDIAFHQRIKTPVMAWSPLAGGALFSEQYKPVHTALQQIAETQSVDVSAVAVAWLLAHPAQILPVMGTNAIDRIRALSRATEVTLSRQAWYEIYTAALGREVA
jgi:predicted oxidoreductase